MRNFTSFAAKGNSVQVFSDTSSVRFVFYKPGVIRVDYLPSLSTKLKTSIVVVQDTTIPVNYSVSETDSALILSTSSIKVICNKNPLRIKYYSNTGQLILHEPDEGGFSANGVERIANFKIQADEHFYGTGERSIGLDLRGQAFDSYNTQIGNYKSPLPTMNINVPFIISTKHYGIYFEDTYKGHFDIGDSVTDQMTYYAFGGELSYYLIFSSSMINVLSDYTWLTGKAPLQPEWAFGYIQSKFGYRSLTDAVNMTQRMRADSIPCDAIIIDLYWYKNLGDFTWNTSNWPNPNKFTHDFLSVGFKTIVITEPDMGQASFNFNEAVNNGYFVNNWQSLTALLALLDLSNPDTQTWLWSKYESIFSTGVTGIWTDQGEPELDSPNFSFYRGPDLEVHNIYNFIWAKILFDGYNHSFPNRRLFNLTRSGYAGIQRFGVVTWSGDVNKSFSGLSLQLSILLNMGMSGIPYHNSDIGGFTGQATTPELYTRWIEFGAFCPLMRAHGTDKVNNTEPWAFGHSTEDIVRNIIQFRYSLFPYNYTMAYQTYLTGIPLARPLILEYPDDPNLYNRSDEYMWGDNLLVAPVVEEGQTEKNVYLPEGDWIYYWNNHYYSGGTTVTVSAPLNEIPIFVKAGSIIPTLPTMNYIDEFPKDTIILNIYPSNLQTSYTLYEDDGKSLAYQSGSFSLTTFTQQIFDVNCKNDFSMKISQSIGSYSGKPSKRIYLIKIHFISSEPNSVNCNTTELQEKKSFSNLRKSLDGFFYDVTNHILYVQVNTFPDTIYEIIAKSVLINRIKNNTLDYHLFQNYPNPFNLNTTIRFSLKEESVLRLDIFNTLGQIVKQLINGKMSAGIHELNFNASNLASGIYFYRIQAGSFLDTKKLTLLK